MQNFIFDIDGTLIDTIEMYIPALQRALDKRGTHYDRKRLNQLFGITGHDALASIEIPEPEIGPLLTSWYADAYQHTDAITVFPGIQAMMATLFEQTNGQVAVVTSKTREEYDDSFAGKYGLDPYIAQHVAADETTGHKPDPEPIFLGMKKLTADPATSIYIGDSIHDMGAAHNASIAFGLATWGATQPEAFGDAEYQFQTPADILKLITK